MFSLITILTYLNFLRLLTVTHIFNVNKNILYYIINKEQYRPYEYLKICLSK